MTKEDFHADFSATIMMGTQTMKVDRDKLLEMLAAMKGAGATAVIDSLAIVSKTETPVGDGGGAVLSVVSKVEATVKVGVQVMKTVTVSHDTLLRTAEGKLTAVYTVADQKMK